MIVYHGTNGEIDLNNKESDIERSTETQFHEGPGLYFAQNEDIAAEYGNTLYQIDVDTLRALDARSEESARRCVDRMMNAVCEQYHVKMEDITSEEYPAQMDELISGLVSGDIACSELPHQMQIILDNDEIFQDQVLVDGEEFAEDIFRQYDRQFPTLIYKDQNKNTVGVIRKPEDTLMVIMDVKKQYAWRLYQLDEAKIEDPKLQNAPSFILPETKRTHAQEIIPACYTCVAEGFAASREGKYDLLDSLYKEYNMPQPADYPGRRMMESDVVILNDGDMKEAFLIEQRFGLPEYRPVPEFAQILFEKEAEADSVIELSVPLDQEEEMEM